MSHKTRLQRIEKVLEKTADTRRRGGRCDACIERPAHVILRARRASPDRPAFLLTDPALGERCECGWRPNDVTRIEETVIRDRAEVATLLAELTLDDPEGEVPVVRA